MPSKVPLPEISGEGSLQGEKGEKVEISLSMGTREIMQNPSRYGASSPLRHGQYSGAIHIAMWYIILKGTCLITAIFLMAYHGGHTRRRKGPYA